MMLFSLRRRLALLICPELTPTLEGVSFELEGPGGTPIVFTSSSPNLVWKRTG